MNTTLFWCLSLAQYFLLFVEFFGDIINARHNIHNNYMARKSAREQLVL